MQKAARLDERHAAEVSRQRGLILLFTTVMGPVPISEM
jgi:hypothetical protein